MTTILTPKPQFCDVANTYNGKELRQPFEDFLIEGVVGINDYLVVPKGGSAASPDAGGGARNRSVDILGLGQAAAWILGDDTPSTQGIYRQAAGAVTANEALAINTSGNPRIDLVVLTITDSLAQGKIQVIQGTPAGSPVAPTLPINSIPLAQVLCADSFSVIAAAQITDARQRAFGHTASITPGADVVLTDNAWTDICTLPLLTLGNDRTIRLEARAEFANTHATQAAGIALRIIDTSQGNAFVVGTGKGVVGANAAGSSDHMMMHINESIPVLAGAHTYKLQGYKLNGTISAIKTETLASQALTCTRLAVAL